MFGKTWSEEQRIISLRNILMRAACVRQVAGSGVLEHLTLEWSLIIQKSSHLFSVNSFASEVWYETASTDMEKWILAESRHFVTYPMRDPYLNKKRALLLLATTSDATRVVISRHRVHSSAKEPTASNESAETLGNQKRKTENENAKLNFKTEAPQRTC